MGLTVSRTNFGPLTKFNPTTAIEKPKQGTRVEDLSNWKSVAYKTALLAPEFLLSGAGWTIGFAIGGNVGAAAGDMLGTALGCVISFGIEMFIREVILNDPSLEGHFMDVLKERAGQALILSAGAFVGGLIFNPALKWTVGISSPTIHAIAAGAITALGSLSGMQTARATYTLATKALGMESNPAFELSKKNLIGDAVLGITNIFPAEFAFYATTLPVFGVSTFMGLNSAVLKGAGAVAIGGTVGHLVTEGAKGVKKRWLDVEIFNYAVQQILTDGRVILDNSRSTFRYFSSHTYIEAP